MKLVDKIVEKTLLVGAIILVICTLLEPLYKYLVYLINK